MIMGTIPMNHCNYCLFPAKSARQRAAKHAVGLYRQQRALWAGGRAGASMLGWDGHNPWLGDDAAITGADATPKRATWRRAHGPWSRQPVRGCLQR